MFRRLCRLWVLLCLASAGGTCSAQGTVIYSGEVVYQSAPYTVVQSPTVVVHSKPNDPCNVCNSTQKPCNCNCKLCYDCEIKLPPNCCKTNCTTTPVNLQVYGSIDVLNEDLDCYVKRYEFEALTKVPYIVCQTKKCVEVSKKSYECIPGCSFQLCVPINECHEKTVKCDLRDKRMKLVAYLRDTGTYDVYVINEPSGQYHAGGMPEKWIVLHCASQTQVRAKFPDAVLSSVHKLSDTERLAAKLPVLDNPDAEVPVSIDVNIDELEKVLVEKSVEKSVDAANQSASGATTTSKTAKS